MSARYRYLVNYILADLPGVVEIETDSASLSTDDARSYVETMRGINNENSVSDIRVTNLAKHREQN